MEALKSDYLSCPDFTHQTSGTSVSGAKNSYGLRPKCLLQGPGINAKFSSRKKENKNRKTLKGKPKELGEIKRMLSNAQKMFN